MAAMADALSTFGASFITFFSIANPIGSALIFDRAVVDLSRSARRRLARHIALLSGVIVIVAALAGSDILHVLGIRFDALRVAGGLVLGVQAWRLIGHNADAGDRGDGRVAARGALVPLTVPLTIGPGTISAAISLGAAAAASPHALVHLGAVLLAVLLLTALIAVAYGNASRVGDLLGKSGSCAAVQLSGFVLLCIAAEMALQGLRNTLSPAFGPA
jgi:multiple antibiotic resistance protein